MPVTVLINTHGLAVRCNRFIYFFPLPLFLGTRAASAFQSFIKNSSRQCQVVVLPHSWLLKMPPFSPGLSQHASQKRSFSRQYCIYVESRLRCPEGLDTKARRAQKPFSALLKHLAHVRLLGCVFLSFE